MRCVFNLSGWFCVRWQVPGRNSSPAAEKREFRIQKKAGFSSLKNKEDPAL